MNAPICARRHLFCIAGDHRKDAAGPAPSARSTSTSRSSSSERQKQRHSPDYRIFAGNYELGAAWQKTSQASRPYLSITLDDPSFPAAIYGRLVESDGGSYNLIWSRPSGD